MRTRTVFPHGLVFLCWECFCADILTKFLERIRKGTNTSIDDMLFSTNFKTMIDEHMAVELQVLQKKKNYAHKFARSH